VAAKICLDDLWHLSWGNGCLAKCRFELGTVTNNIYVEGSEDILDILD